MVRVLSVPDTPPHKGSIPVFSTSENEKKKGLKMKTLFSFQHSKYRELIYRLIPIYGGINHSPPYLLGFSPLGSNKHRRTSEEDEHKKGYDPA
jgi:hypothetical protein